MRFNSCSSSIKIEPINYEKCTEIFEDALDRLLSQDIKLFNDNLSERTICGALSQHIRDCSHEAGLENYYVDVEYNRNRGMVKTIHVDDRESIPINCDIILHSRGQLKVDNLIAVEMKKSYRPQQDKQKDKARLSELTKTSNDRVYSVNKKELPKNVSDYLLGVYLELNPKVGSFRIEYYRNARLVTSKQHGLAR